MVLCNSLNLVSGIARGVTSVPCKCTSMYRFLGLSPVLNPITVRSLWPEGTGCCGILTVLALFPGVRHCAVMFEFVKLIWSPLFICRCMLLSGSAYDVSW